LKKKRRLEKIGVSKLTSGVCLYRGEKVPLGVVRVTPAAVRAKLSICMIIWFTINVFAVTEEIRTERG